MSIISDWDWSGTDKPGANISDMSAGQHSVTTNLRHMWPVAGHGVVALVRGELEAVVSAGAAPGVELVTAEAGDQAWLPGLEVCHLVEVSLSGGILLGSLETIMH